MTPVSSLVRASPESLLQGGSGRFDPSSAHLANALLSRRLWIAVMHRDRFSTAFVPQMCPTRVTISAQAPKRVASARSLRRTPGLGLRPPGERPVRSPPWSPGRAPAPQFPGQIPRYEKTDPEPAMRLVLLGKGIERLLEISLTDPRTPVPNPHLHPLPRAAHAHVHG